MARPAGLEPAPKSLEDSCPIQLDHERIFLFISVFAKDRSKNEDDQKKQQDEYQRSPQRGKNPQPRPSDIAREFQRDEDDCKQAEEADATALSRGVVICHFSSAFHSNKRQPVPSVCESSYRSGSPTR